MIWDRRRTCATCKAVLQETRQGGERIWRCPWVRVGTVAPPGSIELHCDWPYGTRREITEMRSGT